MTNYTKLVRDLRFCPTPYSKLLHNAADAIEALQAEVEELKAKKMKLAENSLRFVGEVRELDKRRFEPKRGEWVEENRRPRSSQFVCSECHRTAYDPQPTRDKAWRKRCRYAYCPNCGAKMEVQE